MKRLGLNRFFRLPLGLLVLALRLHAQAVAVDAPLAPATFPGDLASVSVTVEAGASDPLNPASASQPHPVSDSLKWPQRSNNAAAAGGEIRLKSQSARAILDAWHLQNPQRGERTIRLVYWTPADWEPAPRYRERLSAIMLDIQAWFGREMDRNGLGPRTFKLQKASDGLLQITVACGDKPRIFYGGKTGGEIRDDALKALKTEGINGEKETVVIFCNLTNWDAQTRTTSGDSPYYAYGTTRTGTAWVSDSPILEVGGILDSKDENRVNGQYGLTTLGRYNSIFIGGIAHELGHALSMPHNKERPDEAAWGRSLMGAGNRTYGEEFRDDPGNETPGSGSFLNFADALRLASHPSFSGSIKDFELEATAMIDEVKLMADGQKITYSARVTGTPPVYGIVAYFDPAGDDDYDATTATAIPDQNGRFTLSSDALAKGKSGVLRVVTLQANGAASSGASGGGNDLRYPFNVNREGKVDLQFWNSQQQLAQLAEAVRSGKGAYVERAWQELRRQKASDKLMEIAAVQRLNFRLLDKPKPDVPQDVTFWLSETKPDSEKVGWLQPTYNRLPVEGQSNPLLSAGHQFYARGIYAHAPARHVYNLGRKWSRISGVAGAPSGFSPSVVFVIMGDGKELWRSKKIEADQTAPFNVGVEGVQSLELRVEDGGNGNGSDWAVWLEPLLLRYISNRKRQQ